uniref:C2H2-type domain-containing protein n=1 Tax=Neogobius melanostomus TaxID=47308 RepID=A0A8C6U6B7_9GOBI
VFVVRSSAIMPVYRPFECEICGRTFIANETLISHRRTHSGTKPFSCSLCGKGFTRRHQLKEHGKLHLHTAEYRCPECGQKYRKQGALHNHLRKRHGQMVTAETEEVVMDTQEQQSDDEDSPDLP